MSFTREQAVAADAADPLGAFRGRYLPMAEEVTAYLDGNSLGRPLASIASAWTDFAHQEWPTRLIRGWSEGWMELPEVVGDELGAAALGAGPGQTLIADSTTVNFYKSMRAALNLRPGRRKVLVDLDNFPTDRYVVESLARDLDLEIVWLSGSTFGGVTVEDVLPVLDEQVAVLTLSQVAYRSGFLADLPALTEAAHRVGALVVWDLSHSVGAVPIALDACDVDFAVGCTYKFVGAGPGAPAFSYVNARHHSGLDQPIWGWLGRRDSFDMAAGYLPASGVRSMMSGTPSVLGILAVREGARVIADAGIDAIRAKSVALGEMVIALFDEHLSDRNFGLGSPREASRRGAHVSITRADARVMCERLVATGVIPDFRTPDSIRIGLSPLPAGFVEVWQALTVIADLADR